MMIKSMQVGYLGTNCYILADDSGHAAVIDPGGNGDLIAKAVKDLGLSPEMILLTHGHFDHVVGVPELLEQFPGLPVYITQADYPLARDGGRFPYKMGPVDSVHHYGEGDTVTLGDLTLQVLNTPGHTPGSVVLMVEDALFTGDTLFAGSCGRTDLEGGDPEQMMASLKRLAALPGDYRVYPGHEGFSSLEHERRHNYFMNL